MKTYLDSSAFAKRFVEEAGSDTVEKICTDTTELGLSVICVPEMISALNRRKRERSLTRHQYADVKRRIFSDIRDADIIDLTVSVVACAITVLEKSPIREMDALHIACALEWRAQTLVSSDKKQLDAARRAGMKTQRV